MRKVLRMALGGLGTAALAMVALRLYTTTKYHAQIYSVADAHAPSEHVTIVFGKNDLGHFQPVGAPSGNPPYARISHKPGAR